MSTYHRVAYEDRCQIQAWIAAKTSPTAVARKLGFHKSTISRELRRNSGVGYCSKGAQNLAVERRKRCRKRLKLQGELEQLVLEMLHERWSPQQIGGRLFKERRIRISHEAIYRYIRTRPELDPSIWKKCLRRYKKRGAGRIKCRKNRQDWVIPISERPKILERRGRFGDWERDTMYTAGRKMLLVCVERKSRYLRIDRVKSPVSVHLTEQTKSLLQGLPRKLLSITNDNGGELRDGFCFDVPVYYCDPHSPQQRGTVENTIGLLRQYMPKRSDISQLSDQEIQAIETALNHRPRRCLDYRTPYEVFFGQTVALAS